MFKIAILASLVAVSVADLRMASTPKTNWNVRDRAGSVNYVETKAYYMEPSTFGYQGLANQRQNNYDNFLRSNIDNEQDNRNFNNEAGKDHLPFRTSEAALTDAASDATKKLGADGLYKVSPGTEATVPLRWNNPHASEMEVNIWIAGNTVVVPIKKPTCSGEGYQDGVVSFTVPTDFNTLAAKVPNFTGCNKIGDCVLQVYSHSVESRTYSMGTPLIVTGGPYTNTATGPSAILPMADDVGTDMSKLRTLCLSATDATANINQAVPQWARQVSDVFSHSYQDSNFSPYSGQQPLAISKNLQASSILKMASGNGGELGRSILTNAQKQARNRLRNAGNNLIKSYETVANRIINTLGNNIQKASGKIGSQQLNNVFRAAENGAVSANRLQTNTYVPSFPVPASQMAAVDAKIPAQYKDVLQKQSDGSGLFLIYETALTALSQQFQKAEDQGLTKFYPAMVDAGANRPAGTLADVTQYKKRNAAGAQDDGRYASQQAAAKITANFARRAQATLADKIKGQDAELSAFLNSAEAQGDDPTLPTVGEALLVDQPFPDGNGADECGENDFDPTIGCQVSSAPQLVAFWSLVVSALAVLLMARA